MKSPSTMSGNRIMVGNLPFQADERALGDALGHLGNITDCGVGRRPGCVGDRDGHHGRDPACGGVRRAS